MTKACPISAKRIDENVVRISSALIFVMLLCYLLLGQKSIILFLLFDFSLRLFGYSDKSPLMLASRQIALWLHLTPKMSDEAPKKFALRLGWGLLTAITAALLLHANLFSYLLIATLLLCSALEALFSYCVGCKIYQLMHYMSAGMR